MQCVTAVEPQWLAELGPMFFSIKESHTSRLTQKQREKEESKIMEKEMEEARKAKAQRDEEEAKKLRERQRSQSRIVEPGTPVVRPSGYTAPRSKSRVGL